MSPENNGDYFFKSVVIYYHIFSYLSKSKRSDIIRVIRAGGGMADARALGARGRKALRVQIPPCPP